MDYREYLDSLAPWQRALLGGNAPTHVAAPPSGAFGAMADFIQDPVTYRNKTMSGKKKPASIFRMTNHKLLAKTLRGEIDLNQLAREQLANLGLDADGNWVGLKEAAKIHGTK